MYGLYRGGGGGGAGRRDSADSDESDDSGFGDGLSADAFVQQRIARMREMMNLAANGGDVSSARAKPTTTKATAATTTTPTTTVNASTGPAEDAARPTASTPAAPTKELDGLHLEPPETQTTATTSTTATTTGTGISANDETNRSSGSSGSVVLPPPPADGPHDATTAAMDRRSAAATDNGHDPEGEHEHEHDRGDGDGGDDDKVHAADEEEDEDDVYVVTWAHGQLGLLFKADGRGQTVIRRVNKRAGTADGLQVARAGDVLVAVNGVSVAGTPFQALVERLRLPEFPVTLSFRPPRDDDDDDDAHDEHGGGPHEDLDGRSTTSTMHGGPHDGRERRHSSVSQASTTRTTSDDGWPPRDRPSEGTRGLSRPSGPAHPPPPYYAPPSPSPSQSLPPPPPYAMAPPGRDYHDYYGPPPPEDDPCGPDEYDVVWEKGSLGCGLKQRSGVPIIKTITPNITVEPSVAQIQAGDVMILINGLRTEMIGFKAVVETLQRAPKPVLMRFRRGGVKPPPPPPLPVENLRESRIGMEDDGGPGAEPMMNPHQYAVLWQDGPLGVQIKMRPRDGAVIVSKFTGTGSPEVCSQIAVGDVFVRIAGVEVANVGLGGAYELLKSVQKPVVLVFERGTASEITPVAPLPLPPPGPPPLPHVMYPSPSTLPPPTEEDLRDMTRESTVPSFRLLREQQQQQQLQQQQMQQHQPPLHSGRRSAQMPYADDLPPAYDGGGGGFYRESFAGFNADQRGELLGGPGRRGGPARRPGSYEYDHSNADDRQSEHSNARTDQSSGGQERDLDGEMGLPPPPRFSDIEMGRVLTTGVTGGAVPPPPAYLDVFTQSGRAKDLRMVIERPAAAASSPRGGGSVSSQQSRHPPTGASPSRLGGPPPAPMPPASSPYSHHHHYDPHALGRGGGVASPSIDRLRQQHIHAERLRNQSRRAMDTSQTIMSSYSELDDSGAVAARHTSGGGGRPPEPDLPPPELWIRWREGPLGITFRRTGGQIVVSRLTGAGFSPGLEQLRPGDWLVSFGNATVGSYSTSDLRLSETMELIKRLPKPVDMCFVVQ